MQAELSDVAEVLDAGLRVLETSVLGRASLEALWCRGR